MGERKGSFAVLEGKPGGKNLDDLSIDYRIM